MPAGAPDESAAEAQRTTEVRIQGEDLLIMKESDVLGIINAEAEVRKAA